MKGFAIALASLLLSTSYLVAQPTKSNGSSHSPQQTTNDAKANAPLPSPAQPGTETANKPPSNPPAKEKPERDWVDYVGLGLTAVLAITAIFGTCYALQTLRAIQHEAEIAVAALKESSKLARAAKTSADALTDAAHHAEHSAEFAKAATKDSERADVLIESVSIATGNQNWVMNGDGKLSVRFKNFGRTRARDVTFKLELTVVDMKLARGIYEPPVMVLGAGQEHTITTDTFWDCMGQTMQLVAAGQKEMHFTAFVFYRDVFGDSYTTREVGVFDPRTSSFKILQKIAG